MMNVLNSSLVLLNSSKPVMATIALAFSFLNTSFVLIVMNFEFIALIIIIVYIGAIIILFLFTIMLLHIKDDIYLTAQNENAMLYFTFSFLYFFYFFVIMLLLTEGENLEDFFTNTTINLNNSISINNLLNQTVSNVQHNNFYVNNYYSQGVHSALIYRQALGALEGRLTYSNLEHLFEFYENYDLISRDPLLAFREIVAHCPPHPGINGQVYYSYLELPKRDINTSLAYSLHDYRQYMWCTINNDYRPYHYKLILNSGKPVRTDAVLAGMRFLVWFKEALKNGLVVVETYNLYNPAIYDYFPKELFSNMEYYDKGVSVAYNLKEYQMQVRCGWYENFCFGDGVNHGQDFQTANDLLIHQKKINDFLVSFNFLEKQNLINESLTTRSCNKDLELETELQSLGIVLYTIGCVYFILASIILLIALIGSVVLITSDNNEFVEIQQTSNQISKKGTFYGFFIKFFNNAWRNN